jgi:hypothetical protein
MKRGLAATQMGRFYPLKSIKALPISFFLQLWQLSILLITIL